jgi:hypothetical protein
MKNIIMDKTPIVLVLILVLMVVVGYYSLTLGDYILTFYIIVIGGVSFSIVYFFSIVRSLFKPDSPWRIDIRDKRVIMFSILMGFVGFSSIFIPLGTCMMGDEIVACYQLIFQGTQPLVGIMISIGCFFGGVFSGFWILAVYNDMKRRFKK